MDIVFNYFTEATDPNSKENDKNEDVLLAQIKKHMIEDEKEEDY